MKIKTAILPALAIFAATSTQAGTVIDELKTIAAGYGMKYDGVNDYMGKAYYSFSALKDMNTAPQEVYVPADVQGYREEVMCCQSGFASGTATIEAQNPGANARTPIHRPRSRTVLNRATRSLRQRDPRFKSEGS